jgi:hypothetical protein
VEIGPWMQITGRKVQIFERDLFGWRGYHTLPELND